MSPRILVQSKSNPHFHGRRSSAASRCRATKARGKEAGGRGKGREGSNRRMGENGKGKVERKDRGGAVIFRRVKKGRRESDERMRERKDEA